MPQGFSHGFPDTSTGSSIRSRSALGLVHFVSELRGGALCRCVAAASLLEALVRRLSRWPGPQQNGDLCSDATLPAMEIPEGPSSPSNCVGVGRPCLKRL